MDFTSRLRTLRSRQGLSQAAFAALLGISQSSVAQYEKGRLPDVETIKSICNKTGVSADWLVLGVEHAREESVPHERETQKEPLPEKNGELKDEYISCLKQLATLQGANGDLRLEVEQLRSKIAQLEKDLGEALSYQERTRPVDIASAG